MTADSTHPGRLPASPACCSSCPWPGCPSRRPPAGGNIAGMVGMVLALVATIALAARPSGRAAGRRSTALLIAARPARSAPSIGTWRARTVEMTQMPEMIAILHSFVGIAAVLVGFNSYLTEARPTRCTSSRCSSASSSAPSPSPARSSPT